VNLFNTNIADELAAKTRAKPAALACLDIPDRFGFKKIGKGKFVLPSGEAAEHISQERKTLSLASSHSECLISPLCGVVCGMYLQKR